MGDDADEFTWNVGDGNDRVDGDAGKDAFAVQRERRPRHRDRLRGRRRTGVGRIVHPPFGNVNFAGFEQLKVNTVGGSDAVGLDDLAGTGLGQVRIGLDAPTSNSDDSDDEVDISLGDDSEKVRPFGSRTAGVTVSGVAVPVLMSVAEKLDIAGGVGDDVIDASRLAADAPA
jgi:hypothetical protein